MPSPREDELARIGRESAERIVQAATSCERSLEQVIKTDAAIRRSRELLRESSNDPLQSGPDDKTRRFGG